MYFIGFHYSRNNSPPTFKKGEGKYRSILYQKPIKLLLGSDTATVLLNIKSWVMCCSDKGKGDSFCVRVIQFLDVVGVTCLKSSVFSGMTSWTM